MKMTQKPKWKIILLAMLCLIGMLSLAGGSLSIYMIQAFQRGVARNRNNETVRFTSNYLQACTHNAGETDYAGRTVLFSEKDKSKESLSIEIDVLNYVSGNENLVSQKDITYTMTISVSALSGTLDGKYTAKYENEAEKEINAATPYEKNQMTLTGRNPRVHKYYVTIPGSALDKVKITAAAVPDASSVTNNQKLAAIIAPCTAAETAEFSYDSTFIDATENTSPKEYAAFNYLVSISSGKAEATLEWDKNVLEIDSYFLKSLGKAKNISDILEAGSLTFTMDQPSGTGEYLIPFYIKNKDEISKKTWGDMGKLITFSATQQE